MHSSEIDEVTMPHARIVCAPLRITANTLANTLVIF
jgi:hypothetical protein